MKQILLCPPDYYEIKYIINPWMDFDNPVDKQKAREQYQGLKSLYIELGIEVFELAPDKDLPDMVYAANYGQVDNNVFIKANFKFPQRRKEAEHAVSFFEKKGYEIRVLPEEYIFEGQGDILKVGSKYFLGWGERTGYEIKVQLEEIMDQKIIDLEVVKPHFYHLDTCFGPLGENMVLINPESFTKEGLEKIKLEVKEVIMANDQDNSVMACNLVCVDNNVVLGKGISAQLRENLEEHGLNVYEVEMSEFLKGGGSVKCLTLEMF